MSLSHPEPVATITIKPLPFDSPVCQDLITALDDEVEALYPDAAEFPYEGPGSWLLPHSDPDGAAVQHGAGETETETDRQVVWANEDPEEMRRAEGRGEVFFFVAQAGGSEEVPVGCVAVAMLPFFPLHRRMPDDEGKEERYGEGEVKTAELKRMFVVPGWRGRKVRVKTSGDGGSAKRGSVASLLLQHVETFARERLGVCRMVLETGIRQVKAMRLYEGAGWTKRKEFGDYVGAGEDVGGLSSCYEKWLEV